MAKRTQPSLDIPIGPTDEVRKRHTRKVTRDVAAYLLDRADQYETESPCWIALSDAAHNIMLGAVDEALAHGELEAALFDRVDGWTRKVVRPVDSRLGVDNEG